MVLRALPIDESTGQVDDACLLTYYGCTPQDWEQAANETRFVELIDDRIILHPPPTLIHQTVFGDLFRLVGGFVEAKELGEVLSGPFAMDLGRERKFEPDLVFMTHETCGHLTDDRLLGPADLAIEIASKSTRAYDRGEKRECYRVGGVREYWMIDPFDRQITVDRPAGMQVVEVTEGVIRSEVCPGLWIRAEWLWAEPRPPVARCLEELLGQSKG